MTKDDHNITFAWKKIIKRIEENTVITFDKFKTTVLYEAIQAYIRDLTNNDIDIDEIDTFNMYIRDAEYRMETDGYGSFENEMLVLRPSTSV